MHDPCYFQNSVRKQVSVYIIYAVARTEAPAVSRVLLHAMQRSRRSCRINRIDLLLKYEAQTALFKDPVRTAQ